MSKKPVFVATHPRACSTAFERVFMTRRNSIHTIHEPFGDAFYFGPERMGTRFEDDEAARVQSGFCESTFATIMERIDRATAEDKRVIIKDITHYLVPPFQQPARIAPSLQRLKRGVGTTFDNHTTGTVLLGNAGNDADPSDHDSGVEVPPIRSSTTPNSVFKHGVPQQENERPPFPYTDAVAEPNNPSVVPLAILEKFHFTFLIRHPRHAISSYYRCCIPPLLQRTKFTPFMPEEAGYDELRRLFDYLKDEGLVGPRVCGQASTATGAEMSPNQVEICVIDADDMLDDPQGIMSQYCESIGLEFKPEMLTWDTPEAHAFAKEQFEKWNGFHDDAINSTDLQPRKHKHAPKSDAELLDEWVEKYGREAADLIMSTVKANEADYEYLKQFAIRV